MVIDMLRPSVPVQIDQYVNHDLDTAEVMLINDEHVTSASAAGLRSS